MKKINHDFERPNAMPEVIDITDKLLVCSPKHVVI